MINPNLAALLYLVAGILFILALRGLSSPASSRRGNLFAFLETMFDKKTKAFAVNWDDELVKATVLTRDGAIVHPNIKLPA
jgi:NAD(P) transhydrogenase subunit alpha